MRRNNEEDFVGDVILFLFWDCFQYKIKLTFLQQQFMFVSHNKSDPIMFEFNDLIKSTYFIVLLRFLWFSLFFLF